MYDTDDAGAGLRERPFMRAEAAVGDLGSSFYDEERRRDVWNEASAVDVQLTLWLGLVVANAMVWLGGTDGLPYAVAGLVGVVGILWDLRRARRHRARAR